MCNTVVPSSDSWPSFTISQPKGLLGVEILQNVPMFSLLYYNILRLCPQDKELRLLTTIAYTAV